MLDLSQLETGRLELNLGANDLAEVVRQSVDDLRENIDGRSVKCELNLAESRGVFDQRRIVQVVTNLLSNAIKFSDTGSTIHLSTSLDNVKTVNESIPGLSWR